MKKTIPFDLFGKKQTIYFDILRLAQLEDALGDSIVNVVRRGNAGINFCLSGLIIGLRHENMKADRDFYTEKIDEYFERGGTLDELAVPIIRAILASGIFGQPQEESESKNGEEETK